MRISIPSHKQLWTELQQEKSQNLNLRQADFSQHMITDNFDPESKNGHRQNTENNNREVDEVLHGWYLDRSPHRSEISHKSSGSKL